MGAYGTMTAAGLTALLVAQSEVPDLSAPEQARLKASGRDALAWFQQNWSAEKNPLAEQGGMPNSAVPARYYHLFGLERVGMLTGVRALAGHAWYQEGADVILREQRPDGSWKGEGVIAEDDRVRTAFALLFLARSTREDFALGGR